MAIATNKMKETVVLAYTGAATHLSLHTASPGTTGANEVTGGSPAYARKANTWTAGAEDGNASGAAVTFDVPAATVTHIGIWSAASGGNFLDSYQLPSSQVFASQGQLIVTPSATAS